MPVAELKERHAAATETVNNLREQLRQRRKQLLDTDGNNFQFFFLFTVSIFGNFEILFLRSVWVFGKFMDSRRICKVAREESNYFWPNGSGLLQDLARSRWQGNFLAFYCNF